MNKKVKIALIIAGVVALGVGGYFIWRSQRTKSGSKTKDGRVFKFVKS